MKKTMSDYYRENQEERVKENDIHIGDKVKIFRLAKSRENGWNNSWVCGMDQTVGKLGEVKRLVGSSGVSIYVPAVNEGWNFPYFVLEKISEEEYKKMSDRESYIKRQAEWVKANNLKPGDMVKVLRKARDYESGWPIDWVHEMDSCVGKVLEVKKIIDKSIALYTEDESDWWQYPYFILEKVVDNKDKEWTVSYGLKVKTGDPVLMRSVSGELWTYCVFSHVHPNKEAFYPYRGCGNESSYCIPYKGNEHLVGTTDSYVSEKKESPKFIFGARVRAKLSSGEDVGGVLIGLDKDDFESPYEVAVEDKDEELGRIRYWAESVTYID